MNTIADRSGLQSAMPAILAYFDALPGVLRPKQLMRILAKERAGWGLASRTTVLEFIAFLKSHGKLREYTFEFPRQIEMRYAWGDMATMELLLHLKPRSYFSHYTAMRIHGLTEQVPKVFYLSHERAGEAHSIELDQVAIDAAFQRPVRFSNNAAEFEGWKIQLINSANTGELGVLNQEVQLSAEGEVHVRVTNLERTLIDAVVRPAYSGGVFEVAKAFELAKDQVSVNAMGAMLGKLRFAYPFHQAIGYYLERAGYRASAVDLMRRFPMKFDFYLTHGLRKTRYVPEWRLYVPEGF